MKKTTYTIHMTLRMVEMTFAIIILFSLTLILIYFFQPFNKRVGNFSQNISLGNNLPKYPAEPKLADCQNITHRIVKAFCIADVAEIQRNPKICDMIKFDEQVLLYCKGVTTNSTFCDQILDQTLKQTCYNHTISK